ncbi:sensor histidine kinase [Labedaea rhizosphaerae]|uniref:sensor histidine kinase n=1 Tax=Labedaea rhizosphaerae TaxID=598644 RepID=UPI0014151D24|nr:histidine kinase [Labedaea rhizosphaerae]
MGLLAARPSASTERVLRVCLHVIGIAMVVAFELVPVRRHGPVATTLVLAAVVVWVVAAILGPRIEQPWRTLPWTVVLVLGAIAVSARAPSASILVAAAVLAVVSAVDVPPAWLAAEFGAGAIGYVVGAVLPGFPGTADPFAVLFTVLVAAVVGSIGRNAALRQRGERALLRRRAETAVLAERARIARDLHDVLAHTLGGLVLQLDALDAVVSEKDDPEVTTRVRGARAMAADGLDEAKRAVDALRTFDGPLETTLASLAAQAPSAELTVRGPVDVPAEVADVLASIAVEALTNAAKHAPGQRIQVELTGTPAKVVLRVANPHSGARQGEGHGVRGMRERAALLGSTLTAGPDGSNWVVRCEVPRG